MRGTTQTIYSLILRAQAVVGLLLVGWLMTVVLMAGQYAGASMMVGVFGGVVALACLWPFLTPSWLARPTRRGQMIPLVSTQVTLLMMYSFVAVNAVLTADLGDALNQQLVVGMFSLLSAMGVMNTVIGIRLCMLPTAAQLAGEGGTVTELILATAGPRLVSEPDSETGRRLSQAS